MLRIYSINATHSQEGREFLCSTDEQWVELIMWHQRVSTPLYITPRSRDTYIFRHFVEPTLDENGYIIPGDYETETPELGKVKYSISNEHNDYNKALFPKNEPKLGFWQRNKSFIKTIGWSMLTVSVCCMLNNIFQHFGYNINTYPFVVGWLFGELHWKNGVIKKLEKKQ
ncbi:hypothetical protein [uncultured Muribaculum sp.]|uniref:hypothetical protein n=1 Tax=uncultured Muribaculum sp. TaxID=1918613 RepID=UPI00272FB216|nr:hypothetical protein [uncultured Muribaculum sp.]